METPIQKANNAFKSGNYSEALKRYKQIATKYPHLNKIVQANIEICRIRIRNNNQPKKEENGSPRIAQLLSTQITREKREPDIISYLSAIRDIKAKSVGQATFEKILSCAHTSPFQRSLLKVAANYAEQLEIDSLVEHYSTESELNLAKLIKLATNNSYWLCNRKAIHSTAKKEGITSRQLSELVDHPPNGSRYQQVKLTTDQEEATDRQKRNTSFGTILLNEQKFIGENLAQHYHLCDEWILVEGACLGYPERKVSPDGLSLDATKEIISLFPDPHQRLTYIQYGWTKSTGEDAKSELRNEYLKRITGDHLVVIDADEFYLDNDLKLGVSTLQEKSCSAVVLPQVHFWKTTDQFITGEYYDISHTRIYRHIKGMRYIRNHNFPEINGKFVHEGDQFKFPRTISKVSTEDDKYTFNTPKCYHMGFAKDYDDMKDKTEYYVNRGEDKTRIATTKSRAAWFDGELPEKCRLRNWGGEIPASIEQESSK